MTTNTNNSAGTYAPVNGINLYYEIHGTGQPLIMLHLTPKQAMDLLKMKSLVGINLGDALEKLRGICKDSGEGANER
jgi:hypothetical protein